MAGARIAEATAARVREALARGGSIQGTARECNVDRGTVRKIWYGMRDETPPDHRVPEGQALSGVSTLYDQDGMPRLQWVKTRTDQAKYLEQAREVVAELCQDIRPVRPVGRPSQTDPAVLTSYNIGDAHIGMLSWGDETGDNWDLKIAEESMRAAVGRLVEAAPRSEEALVVNFGDYFHMDDRLNQTPGSKNPLDVDGRYLQVLRVGVRTMRGVIETARRKHKRVRVRNVAGNHDPHTSVALTLALSALYENEPGVVIEDSPKAFWTYRHGKCLIGIHHGHQIKRVDDMAMFLAAEAPEDWGQTEHRFVWHGHIHHLRSQERGKVLVESFRTLAGPDAWHAASGYKSGRAMQAVVLHAEYGETERHTATIQSVRAAPER